MMEHPNIIEDAIKARAYDITLARLELYSKTDHPEIGDEAKQAYRTALMVAQTAYIEATEEE